MSSDRNSLATLAWLVEAGADEAIGEEAMNRFAAAKKKVPSPTLPSPLAGEGNAPSRWVGERDQSHPPTRSAGRPLPQGAGDSSGAGSTDPIGSAMQIAAACYSLAELKAAMEKFEGSPLKKTASNTVFADGAPDAKIMLIGEAPGAEEDRAGQPFVGRAGQLLDKMLAAIGLDRRSNAYITNVLNWRPPANRDPSPEEAAINLPFLRRHIELKDPQLIVLLGAVAMRHVLGSSDGIMRSRGQWKEYFVNDRMVPIVATLHPAYLLRRPADKKLAWRDLQAIEARARALGLL